MGASDSKHTDESQRLDSSHPSEDETHPTPPVNKRLLRLTDPRSPTDGLDRTPIVTEKPDNSKMHSHEGLTIDTSSMPEEENDLTHDPRSPTADVARTPQPFKFEDPRSPSGGVARTPFIPHANDASDPRSPTEGIERTPFVKGEKEGSQEKSSSFECLVDDPKPSETVQENLNTSNNNIDAEHLSTIDSCTESQRLIKDEEGQSESAMTQIDAPQYEAELSKMVEEQTLVDEAADSQESQEEDDGVGIISTTDASEHRPKTRKHKRSLKDKVQLKLHGGAPRSPLSTRNLLSDSPSLQMSTGSNSVSFTDKNARRRHTAPTPTRLVGRYEPILDKENV